MHNLDTFFDKYNNKKLPWIIYREKLQGYVDVFHGDPDKHAKWLAALQAGKCVYIIKMIYIY